MMSKTERIALRTLKKIEQNLNGVRLLENEWPLYNVLGQNPYTAKRVEVEAGYFKQLSAVEALKATENHAA